MDLLNLYYILQSICLLWSFFFALFCFKKKEQEMYKGGKYSRLREKIQIEVILRLFCYPY